MQYARRAFGMTELQMDAWRRIASASVNFGPTLAAIGSQVPEHVLIFVSCLPVFPLIDDLKTPVCIRRHTLNQGDLLRDRRRISKNQRAITPGAKADPISGPASSFYPNKIVSQALKLLLYAAAACIPNRHNADERAYSHRDSQNRKNTSDPVAAQRRGSFSDCILKIPSRYVNVTSPISIHPAGA